jgi:hypothetical protein
MAGYFNILKGKNGNIIIQTKRFKWKSETVKAAEDACSRPDVVVVEEEMGTRLVSNLSRVLGGLGSCAVYSPFPAPF